MRQNTWRKTSYINIWFGMRWKYMDASVLQVQSLMVRVYFSASGTWYSRETMLMRTLEVLVRNVLNSSYISNWTTMKPCHATSLWMFPMHLMSVSTLPFLKYFTVRNKILMKIVICTEMCMTKTYTNMESHLFKIVHDKNVL